MKRNVFRTLLLSVSLTIGLLSISSAIDLFADQGGGTFTWCDGDCPAAHLRCQALMSATGTNGDETCCDGKYTERTCTQISGGSSCTDIKCDAAIPF